MIEVRVDGGRADIVLARPQKRNPLSTESLAEIEAAAVWIDSQEAIQIVIVSGLGRSFSAGAEVSIFTEVPRGAEGRRVADGGRRMADAIERMQQVVIAKIHGHCVGGGVVLASACDLRLAAEDTYFSIPEIDLGIPLSWGGIPRLVREMGPALTKELVMTCRPFTAAEAKNAGFLNSVVSAVELDRAVDDLAATLLSKPRLALLSTKRHVNAVTEQMVGSMRSWSDADGLMAGLNDPEGRASAERYLQQIAKR